MDADAVFKRDRRIVLTALTAITVLTWVHMYQMSPSTALTIDAAVCSAPTGTAWNLQSLLLAFLMWNVMMVGMMIPTASPMILMFATTNRRHRDQNGPFVPTAIFVLGYVIVWTGYSAGATLAQWGMHSASLLTPYTLRTTPAVGGLLLIAAGLFQWSPLKHRCLTQCQTPLSFLMTEWREGTSGALLMGLKHGAYCVGCCWAIMALMFVAGAMNLLWTALLTAFMLVEKVAPARQQIEKLAGIVFVFAGVGMVYSVLV